MRTGAAALLLFAILVFLLLEAPLPVSVSEAPGLHPLRAAAAAASGSDVIENGSLSTGSLAGWTASGHPRVAAGGGRDGSYSAVVADCPSDPYEDNGSFGSAALIAAGASVAPYICPEGDQDYFKFWVITGQDLTVLLDDPPAAYDLEVYDANRAKRISSYGAEAVPRELSFTADVTGYWYARALGNHPGQWSEYAYSLRVTLGGVPEATATKTPTLPATSTSTAVIPPTHTRTATWTATRTPALTVTLTATWTATRTPTGTVTPTATRTATRTPTRTVTPTASVMPTETPPYPWCPNDVHEPNDECGGDQPSWNLTTSTTRSYICATTDVDFWRIPLVNAGETIDIALQPGSQDYRLWLYDPQCQSVKPSMDAYQGTVRLRHTAAVSGTWFVKVHSALGFSVTEPYTITGRVEACVRDRLEDNDDVRRRTTLDRPLTVHVEENLSLCPADEQDWFGVRLEEGDVLMASLTHNSGVGPLKMCLYDVVATNILQCTDPFLGLNKIDYIPSSRGTYYLVVDGAAPGVVNHNYSISVHAWVPTPTATPTNTRTPTPTRTPMVDLTIQGIEITQAIQDLNNSIPLVKGKLTRARVYVGVPPGVTRLSGLEIWLSGYTISGGSVPLPGSPLKMGPGTYALSDATLDQKRLLLASSFNFDIPASWQGYNSIAVGAIVNPNWTVAETNYFNNDLSDTVSWRSCSTVNLKLVSVTSDGVTVSLSSALVTSALSWLKDVYPIGQLNVSFLASGSFSATRDYAALGAGGYCSAQWGALVDDMAHIYDNWSNRPANAFVYGFLSSNVPHCRAGVCNLGCGSMNGHAAAGILAGDAGETLAHEVGHNLGRKHAPCGVPDPDPGWPTRTNPNASIGEVGVRWSTSTAFGTGTPDFMSYCHPPWVAPYTYTGLQAKLCAAAAAVDGAASLSPSPHLVASGWTSDGALQLRPFWVLDQPAGSYDYPGEGPYSLELQDASGAVLLVRRFDPAGANQGPGHSTDYFHEIVPFAPETQRVVFRHGDAVLGTVAVSPHSPQVTVLSPNGGEVWGAAGAYTITWRAEDADGDPLVAHVLYSFDGGESWEPLAVNVHGNQYVVQGSALPGSNQVLVQVRVSDGVNTGNDQSDAPFRVSRKAPAAFVLQPHDGAVVRPGSPVVFSGLATDPEDGPLPVESLVWTSDVDGALGAGADVAVDTLSTGMHHITLSAADSDGNVAQDAISLLVGNVLYLPVVLKQAWLRPNSFDGG